MNFLRFLIDRSSFVLSELLLISDQRKEYVFRFNIDLQSTPVITKYPLITKWKFSPRAVNALTFIRL